MTTHTPLRKKDMVEMRRHVFEDNNGNKWEFDCRVDGKCDCFDRLMRLKKEGKYADQSTQ